MSLKRIAAETAGWLEAAANTVFMVKLYEKT
jgi:hypothetical protein